MIYPIIIWPFLKPVSSKHLKALIDFLKDIDEPLLQTPTIIINKSSEIWVKNSYSNVIKKLKKLKWNIKWVWSVETCQTWLTAFGEVNDLGFQSIKDNDSFLLIPGDFHYSSKKGKLGLNNIRAQFKDMISHDFDIVIGQLNTDNKDFKELIDAFGTWELLNVWFPSKKEALIKIIKKPRSEFISLSRKFLSKQLNLRWYPYTQTLVFLLRLLDENRSEKIKVFDLGELKEDRPPDPLFEAIGQVERIEKVLKHLWREKNKAIVNRDKVYLKLSQKSNAVVNEFVINLCNEFKES